jgi:hypothetical protein
MRNLTRWLVAFVAALALGATLMQAQPPQESQILAGPDVGFRVEGHDVDGRPYGTWMIRVDGRWVEPHTRPTVHRATQH